LKIFSDFFLSIFSPLERFKRVSFNEDDVIKSDLTMTWISKMEVCFQPTYRPEYFKPINDMVKKSIKTQKLIN
jgi:hypothetical protein